MHKNKLTKNKIVICGICTGCRREENTVVSSWQFSDLLQRFREDHCTYIADEMLKFLVFILSFCFFLGLTIDQHIILHLMGFTNF